MAPLSGSCGSDGGIVIAVSQIYILKWPMTELNDRCQRRGSELTDLKGFLPLPVGLRGLFRPGAPTADENRDHKGQGSQE